MFLADIISCVEFNNDGSLLAAGDKGGRIVIFREAPSRQSQFIDYAVYSTFQSHEPEFDYLKSVEIEEKINRIRWLHRCNQNHFLLSTNDKTVKLWRICERTKRIEGGNLIRDAAVDPLDPFSTSPANRLGNDSPYTTRSGGRVKRLQVPRYVGTDLVVEASPKRVFANAHQWHINSISVNSDQQLFLSADDLRINVWHLEQTTESFNIVDIKPANMEELSEVITSSEFHPRDCNLFIYSSSKGIVRLCDMRCSALCDREAKVFEMPSDPATKTFFSDIINSISDARFSHSGRLMATRDYMSVKVWDLAMERQPVEIYSVHDYLRPKLCVLYENDCIFDKFEVSWSYDDRCIASGTYHNSFKVIQRDDGTVRTTLPSQPSPNSLNPATASPNAANPSPMRLSTRDFLVFEATRDSTRTGVPLRQKKIVPTGKKAKKEEISVDDVDITRKILHTSCHPNDNILAIVATNNLFIYQAQH